MPRTLDPASVRAYVARDWRALRERKRAYWRARLERGGLTESLAITDQLRAGLQQLDATWPTEHEREEDLETHRRVAAALARTASTTPRSEARRPPRPRSSRSLTSPSDSACAGTCSAPRR